MSAGYSFTPDADLLVTHVRHYSGGRVSIWTDDGVLLTAREVSDFGGFPGTWLETPLLMPLVLYAGNTYRVTLWSDSNRYYWRNTSVTTFPYGLIGPSYVANTDVFPEVQIVFPSRTWLVDLRYTVGVSNSVAVVPPVSGNFVDGVWTGSVTVLQGARNMSLTADDGAGHAAKSNPFTVSVTNDVVLDSVSSLDSVPLGDPITYTVAVTNTGPAAATLLTVSNQFFGPATVLSATASQGTLKTTGNSTICTLASLDGGTSATISFVVMPTNVGLVALRSSMKRAEVDASYENNSTLVVTPILDRPGISIFDTSVGESDTNATNAILTVQLPYPTSQSVSVDYYATANGSATAGSDFQSASGTLFFAPGITNLTISIPILGDLLSESNEVFLVNLSNPTNASIARSQGKVTIKDNDPLPSLAISDAAVVEGNSGTTNAVFSVVLSAVSERKVTVNYQTTNGTATAGNDYLAKSGTLTFLPGVTNQTISVPVMGDLVGESNEVFFVSLTNAVNASIAQDRGVGTIINDDPFTLLIDDTGVIEGNSNTVHALFSVWLSPPSSNTVTVSYASADGTAFAGQDYIATNGMLVFAPGSTTQTVEVVVFGDKVNEANETLLVNLSNATNATIVDSQAVCVITNDDPLPFLVVSSTTVMEGDKGTTNAVFQVSLSRARERMASVHYATANGTATAGSDYIAQSGTLTFSPSATNLTVAVQVLGDLLVETNEVFYLNLSAAVNASIGVSQGVGTILNDDGFPGQVHHFEWSPISSPQLTGLVFSASITARDYFNNTVTNFAGPVSLFVGTNSPAGILTPQTADVFSNGVWSGSLAVSQASTNLILGATNSDGFSGFSNPFEVGFPDDLIITLRADREPVYAGDTLTYTITATNTGPDPISGVNVAHTLPASMTLISAAASQGSWSQSGQSVNWNVGTLPPGANALLDIIVQPTIAGAVTNRATGDFNGSDPNPPNNSATVLTLVLPPLHHFNFSTLGATEQSLIPFPVTITARDRNNNLVSNFNGSVSFSATRLFKDDFEDGNLEGWSPPSPDGSSIIITNLLGGTNNNAVNLIGESGISHSFPNLMPSQLSFRVRMALPGWDTFCTIGSGQSEVQRIVHFRMSGGLMYAYYGINATYSRPYSLDRWYQVTFVFDWAGKVYDWYVDGSLVAARVPFYGANATFLADVSIYNWFPPSTSWWDDVEITGDAVSNSVGVTPTTLGAFTNGIWYGPVTFAQPVTNVQLRLTDGLGHDGLSGTLTVVPGPHGVFDHFDWSEVGVPIVNQSFTATLTAKDLFGDTVTNYTGAPLIRATRRQAVRVLILSAYAPPSGVQGPLDLISLWFTNFTATTTTNTLPGALSSDLDGKEIFILPWPSLAPGNFGELASQWAGVLTEFVNRGGIVISCGDSVVMNNSGLMSCTTQGSWFNFMLQKSTTHILNEGVATPFLTPSGVAYFYSTNAINILEDNAGAPVVLVRDIGLGHAVLVGSAMVYTPPSRTGLDQILANAVKWAQPQGLDPLPLTINSAGGFTNGVWTGSFVISSLATNAYLQADNGHLVSSFSAPFSIGVVNDIGLTMTLSNKLAIVGEPLNFLLTITNVGPDPATGIRLTNGIPPGASFVSAVASQGSCILADGNVVCDLGTLTNGGDVNLTITLTASQAGTISNYANTARGEPDFFADNNFASVIAMVIPPTSFYISDTTVLEGDVGTTNAIFQVKLFPPSLQTTSVGYATMDGTAIAGLDYAATNGVLTFLPGVTNQTLAVAVNGDLLSESNETFTVRLSGATNALVGASDGVCTIIDNNDPFPLLSVDSASVWEGDFGTMDMVFQARLSGVSGRTVSVEFATADGTATSGRDFDNASGVLIFAPGITSQTFHVVTRGNTINEPDKFFLVNLLNATNAVLAYTQTPGVIRNDDALPGKLDHFELSGVPASLIQGQPFLLSVSAKDSWNYTITNANGTFNLDCSRGHSSNRLEILSWTRFASDNRYPGILTAISNWFTNFHETNTTTVDPVLLTALLKDKDVFLLPAQSVGGYLGMLGTSWSPILNEFVNRGGILIVCSDNYDEHLLLVNSGLLNLSRVGYDYSGSVFQAAPSRLTEGVSNTFTGAFVITYLASNGVVALRTVADNYAVVIQREVGAGAVFMIGSGFFSLGSQMDHVLANAVSWNYGSGVRTLALTTGVGPRLNNGLWTGNIVIPEAGTNYIMRAFYDSGHLGWSNPFDVAADTDSDGMPDDWERANSLNPNDPTDALADVDGDGLNNLSEFLAGTDPRDAASALRITGVQINATTLTLQFPSVSGRSYRIESTDDLGEIRWTVADDGIIGTGGVIQRGLAVSPDPAMRFYRVRLLR